MSVVEYAGWCEAEARRLSRQDAALWAVSSSLALWRVAGSSFAAAAVPPPEYLRECADAIVTIARADAGLAQPSGSSLALARSIARPQIPEPPVGPLRVAAAAAHTAAWLALENEFASASNPFRPDLVNSGTVASLEESWLGIEWLIWRMDRTTSSPARARAPRVVDHPWLVLHADRSRRILGALGSLSATTPSEWVARWLADCDPWWEEVGAALRDRGE